MFSSSTSVTLVTAATDILHNLLSLNHLWKHFIDMYWQPSAVL